MIENESIRFPQGFLIENKPIEIIIPYFISTLPDGINNRIRDLRELFGNALRKINRHIDIVSYFCKHLEKEFKNGLKMNVFGSKTIVPKAKNNDPMFWCFLFYIMVFHFNNHQFDDHKQITEDITEYIIELSLERSNDLFRSYINELSKEYQSIKKLLMKNPEQINKLQSFYLDSIYPIFKITDLLYDKIVRFRDNMKIHWYDSVIKNYFKENCWFMDFDTEVKKFMKFEELDQISPLPAILLLFVLIEKLEGVKVPIKTHLVNQVNNFTKEFLKKYDIAFVFSTKKLINNKIQTFNDEQLLQIYPKLIKAAVGYITTIRDFLVQKGNLQEETIQQFIQITCTYLQNSYNNFYDCVKEIMFKFSEDQEIKTPKQFTEELNKQF
ncbi:hypothetical protein TRFO_31102 [Tritrichomonas foetus]|uniref:Uncharacterized protein n=1 Tax=Tritrichomonas foetus TaxID=1144522 RepID=A0A1J4JSE0_9EUKA|nr:hypothetical protein TRFO_31102 [Tritrichomonas foetus]|eukprot:OHT01963.1 hypothetical protein TRFO_31102 [Tritrichomonas foetus]